MHDEQGIFNSWKWTVLQANLHCHSTFSDGMLTPADIKALYIKNGYSIVAYTDHNVLNYFGELDDSDFLVIKMWIDTDGLLCA